ncbi:DUF445 family protein [Desulfonatronospira sp.]|uniref:DUF445 domain-containing protein n=1 Tax=Desulfonatronospira sp. TaxID=1962951 RepID=UPI0025B95C26|nr:DUF445 family protein [Desulfonatronospira sp.]
MEYYKFIMAPFIGALIGWLTNYLAVKMLFYPRKPINILGWKLQGVFPKRQQELASSLGKIVEREFISHEDIQKVINDPRFRDRLNNILSEYIHNLLSRKLNSLHPVLAGLLSSRVADSLQARLSRESEKILPQLLQRLAEELEHSLDFKEVVRHKVENFSMDKLEEVLFSIMRKEFRFIEIIGAVLGFVIGTLQALFFFFA